jgi:hypothetical protein
VIRLDFFCVYIHESRCLKVRKPDGSVVFRGVENVCRLEVDMNEI